MTEIQTPQSTSGPESRANATITLVRLVRLRRDDDKHQPSRVYAQVVGDHPGGQVSALGQSELFYDGNHIPLPSEAWTSGESLIESLVGRSISLSDNRDTHSTIEALISTEQLAAETLSADYSPPAFDAVCRAIREAFLMFCGGYPLDEAPDELGAVLNKKMTSVTRYFVAPSPAPPTHNGTLANSFQDAPFIEPLPKDGTKGHLLEREALRYGMSSTRYPNGAFVVTDPATQKQLGFKWGRSPLASGVALSICSYKEATRRLLKRVDVPVPQGRVFSTSDGELALQYADRIGYPVVCKPVAGLRGIGVISNIRDRRELEDALRLYQQSELGDDDFVIEEHVPGEDYRIVVIGDQVVASVVRAPASVTGDGIHTIADLIEHKNRARRDNPHLSSRLIRFNESLEYQLKLRNFSYSTVPGPNELVILANSANLSQGGDSFEVSDELHQSIKDLSVKAVQAIPGLGFCGLDMLIEDHTKPIWEQRVTVIELNAHAAIGSAQYPMWGKRAPVARQFFEATAAHSDIALLTEQNSHLSLMLTVRGRVGGRKYRGWFYRRATNFGVNGYVKNDGKGRVVAYVNGNADAVSALGYLAIQGPSSALATSVTMTPSAIEHYNDFRIISNSRAGMLSIRAMRLAGAIRRRIRRELVGRPAFNRVPDKLRSFLDKK